MPAKWRPEYILQTYLLAEQGNNQEDISKSLGIHQSSFITYKKQHPELRLALRKGIAARKKNRTASENDFHEYVYGRLPRDLIPTWNEIMAVERPKYIRASAEVKKKRNENGIVFLEKLLEGQGKRARQYLFVHALTSSCFNLSQALRMTHTKYSTYRKWKDNDAAFSDILEQLEFHMGNFVEGSLMKLVAMLDPGSVRFACERLLRKKYGPELKIKGDIPVAKTAVINIVQILTTDEKKELLAKVRKHVDSKEVKQLVDGKDEENKKDNIP